MNRITCVLLFLMYKNYVASVRPKIECGYKQCPQTREGALNVHLIPHSHMDIGWVKTFDEYYFGTKTSVSTANVHLIYHSVLSELLHDKRRKFTFSETAYFWRWWKEQKPTTRATFRSLVQEGRIEFAGGGWVLNDAATLDYLQIIDQYTWGLRKLNDTLGSCGKPKAAWQIDTYGHTREQTSLLAQMGYDGLFIGRVDHSEREAMIDEDRMEFMWRGSDVLGKMSDIMTHTLFNLYNAPEGFCFDFLCSDEPIVDDPDSQAYNAEKRVNDFIFQLERQAKYYDHDNILVTMGGDFTYQSAANWYINLDKLINHINTHPGNVSDVHIFYSTPSCFLKAIYLYGRRDKAIYTEKGDHIPYASDATTYWTGYYTSRPALKYFIRRAQVFLQIVKQLTVIARMGDSFELHLLRHATNLVLHHDAITGTSQQHVTNDFVRRLSEAVTSCTKKVSHLLSYLTPTWGNSRRSKNSQQFVVCHQLNMSQCRFAETQDTILLLVYNPSSVKTYHHVRLPAVALHYSVRDYNDEEVEYQIVPLPAAVINLPGRTSTVIQELYFEAENIPPLGYTSYFIQPVRDQLEENAYAKKHNPKEKPTSSTDSDVAELVNNITNEYIKVTVNKETGLLESIQHVDGAKIEGSQNFFFYSQGQTAQQSGAYSFRPEHSRPTPVADKASYSTVRGIIIKEIRQRFTDWVTQVIRLYRGEEFVEFEWVVGPVPIGTDLGKEVVSIFSTNISSNGVFYTDSNARQMMKRSCWNETSSQPQKKLVSGCYFPVVSRICLQSMNTSTGLCVLTDRAQGGTSYNDGEIELMVHRRLLTDDGFGLEESLNEEEFGVGLVVRGRHRLYFGHLRQDIDDMTFHERMAAAARRWQLEPWPFIAAGDKVNRRKWQNVRNKRYTVLRVHALPRHVHVLSLEPWKGGAVLLRLENTLEKAARVLSLEPWKGGAVLLRLENTLEKAARGRPRSDKLETGPEEYPLKAAHLTVHLRRLFTMKVVLVRETTLAANQWLDDARQMDWSSRYVYQGADDDILPEDNVQYPDDSKRQEDEKDYKDTGGFSEEEDWFYRIKKTPKVPKQGYKRKPKASGENLRSKRHINSSVTEDIIENIINGTFTDKSIEFSHNKTKDERNDYENKTVDFKTAVDDINKTADDKKVVVDYNNETVDDVNATTESHVLTTVGIKSYETSFRNITVSSMCPKKYFQLQKAFRDKITKTGKNKHSFKILKPIKYRLALYKSNEDFESTEDYPAIYKKHRKPKMHVKQEKRFKETELPTNDDDGITKSMFEMYYKSSGHSTVKQQTEDDYVPSPPANKQRIRRKKYNLRKLKGTTDSTEGSGDSRHNAQGNIEDYRHDQENSEETIVLAESGEEWDNQDIQMEKMMHKSRSRLGTRKHYSADPVNRGIGKNYNSGRRNIGSNHGMNRYYEFSDSNNSNRNTHRVTSYDTSGNENVDTMNENNENNYNREEKTNDMRYTNGADTINHVNNVNSYRNQNENIYVKNNRNVEDENKYDHNMKQYNEGYPSRHTGRETSHGIKKGLKNSNPIPEELSYNRDIHYKLNIDRNNEKGRKVREERRYDKNLDSADPMLEYPSYSRVRINKNQNRETNNEDTNPILEAVSYKSDTNPDSDKNLDNTKSILEIPNIKPDKNQNSDITDAILETPSYKTDRNVNTGRILDGADPILESRSYRNNNEHRSIRNYNNEKYQNGDKTLENAESLLETVRSGDGDRNLDSADPMLEVPSYRNGKQHKMERDPNTEQYQNNQRHGSESPKHPNIGNGTLKRLYEKDVSDEKSSPRRRFEMDYEDAMLEAAADEEPQHRSKRAPPSDPPEGEGADEEPEYIITLRPTQIRTFVVYFEKKDFKN